MIFFLHFFLDRNNIRLGEVFLIVELLNESIKIQSEVLFWNVQQKGAKYTTILEIIREIVNMNHENP